MGFPYNIEIGSACLAVALFPGAQEERIYELGLEIILLGERYINISFDIERPQPTFTKKQSCFVKKCSTINWFLSNFVWNKQV